MSSRSELLRELAGQAGQKARTSMLCGGYYAPEWSQREARYAFSLAIMALEEEGCKCRLVERGLFLLCPKHVSKEEVDYYLEHAPTGSDFS
jgi:hypothetical protein